MTDELRYLYAITDAAAATVIAGRDLRGIEGGHVEAVVEGGLLAATSAVPASDYEERPLNEHLQDLDWLAPRAAAHQDVNAKLLELTRAVLPVAFGAIYRGEAGVRALLRDRADDLRERLQSLEGRAEWIVSVERERMAAVGGEAVQQLDAEIAVAAPGRAFLLGKRRDEVARDERRASDAAAVEEVATAIEAVGERIHREPLIDDPAVPAVARFSVLAQRDREAELKDAVRRLGASGASRGYRVRVSGPWPPYRFGGLRSGAGGQSPPTL